MDKYDKRNWLLTDEEKERGGSQEARNQAYIEAGGIIYNKDAFGDMYEALKIALEFFVQYDAQNSVVSGMSLVLNEALAKAEGRL